MTRLLIATTNPGKIRELRTLLVGLPVDLVTPIDLGLSLEVEESGDSYAENASLKAVTYARSSGLVTLADDSGLEVDVLGGLPGIRSARFSTKPGATDADRRAYLLGRLSGCPRPWAAHFHCTVALASPGLQVRLAEGDCPGEIIPEERGQNGFGYDPIFLLPEISRTMAELTMEEKNRLSHRARAVQASRPILAEMIASPR